MAGSILFRDAASRRAANDTAAPAEFGDLALDRVVAAVTSGAEAKDLAAFFNAPLPDTEDVVWRHEVFRDLERPDLLTALRKFAERMAQVRRWLQLAAKLHWSRQQERWQLDALALWGQALAGLSAALAETPPKARGLQLLRDAVAGRVAQASFQERAGEAARLLAALAAVETHVLIVGDQVRVRASAGEADFGAEVEAAFIRFGQGEVKDPRFGFRDDLEMNNIEAKILDLIAENNAELFNSITAFVRSNQDFLEEEILDLDREVRFCLAWLDYQARFVAVGLPFSLPQIVGDAEVEVNGAFDLALATLLLAAGKIPVFNDFSLRRGERMAVVSGPNQGGKTTFSRMIGQIFYLASLGLPVAAAWARLPLCDRVFTHYERQEDASDRRGKLENDLVRVHAILVHATDRSLVILNEIFTSTTLSDARFLSREIAAKLLDRGCLVVWVTFLEELSVLSPATVSYESSVAPDDPARRTFRIERRPADGLAHALAVAAKWRLTAAAIRERLVS